MAGMVTGSADTKAKVGSSSARMILLVASAHSRRSGFAPVGDFVTPIRWQPIGKTSIWAADNGAFNGFDEVSFIRMLDRIQGAPVPPKFVTLPDVVASHDETMRLFGRWHRELARRNINRAFVLQDGLERYGWKGVPWDYCEAIFIGGTDAFKLGPAAREVVQYGKLMKKWIHMGRVNSVRRLRYAQSIGCDSVDGSGMARFPRVLHRMVNHLSQVELWPTSL